MDQLSLLQADRADASDTQAVDDAQRREEYRIVSVRLRSAEFDEFAATIKAFDLTGSMALRIAARRIGGFLEIDADVRRSLHHLLAAIGEVSASVRALQDVVITTGALSLEELAPPRQAFGLAFAELDALLRAILNVSRRREDGRQLLAEAMA
jgi:type IV secretion system T-DNA border endonuclease VirD1